jgi:hypothetical protein
MELKQKEIAGGTTTLFRNKFKYTTETINFKYFIGKKVFKNMIWRSVVKSVRWH